MATNIRHIDGITIVEIVGKMFLGPDTEECHKKVRAVLTEGYKKVVIDLSGAEWVNSRGMGSLMACYVSNMKLGGKLKFAGLTDKTHSLFHTAKLDTVFQIYDTVDNAISSFD